MNKIIHKYIILFDWKLCQKYHGWKDYYEYMRDILSYEIKLNYNWEYLISSHKITKHCIIYCDINQIDGYTQIFIYY